MLGVRAQLRLSSGRSKLLRFPGRFSRHSNGLSDRLGSDDDVTVAHELRNKTQLDGGSLVAYVF